MDATVALRGHGSRLTGHGQVMDAYLVALVRHHEGVLATFDRGLAGKESARWIEVIPG